MTRIVRTLTLAVVGMAIAGLTALAIGQASALEAPKERTSSIICRVWEKVRVDFLLKHGESTVATGVTDKEGARVVVLASVDGDTFSIFRVYPDGVGCLILSGTGLEITPDGSGDET